MTHQFHPSRTGMGSCNPLFYVYIYCVHIVTTATALRVGVITQLDISGHKLTKCLSALFGPAEDTISGQEL